MEHYDEVVDGTRVTSDVAFDALGRLWIDWTGGTVSTYSYDDADQLVGVRRSDSVMEPMLYVLVAIGVVAVIGTAYVLAVRTRTRREPKRESFSWSSWVPDLAGRPVGSVFVGSVNGFLSSGVGARTGNFLLVVADERTLVFVYCAFGRHFEALRREDDPVLIVDRSGLWTTLRVEGRTVAINETYSTINSVARSLQERGWMVR